VILAALWIYAAIVTALFARQHWRARRDRQLANGFVASGMTIEALEPYVQTEADRRREYRVQLIALLEDAEYALTEAKATGRRLDCLGAAVCGIRGALQNVCMEDGVPFVEDDQRAEWRQNERATS